MDSAMPRRGIGETPLIRPWDAVDGTYPGIGGDDRAYEDEKAAFASRSCIGSFREARSTTLRPDTPSGCVKKNVGRDRGSQIEHLEPHRTCIQRRKHTNIRRSGWPIPPGPRTYMICSAVVHFQGSSPTFALNTSGSDPAPAPASA